MADIILTEKRLTKFWARTKVSDESGCILWTGSKWNTGYGRIIYGGKHVGVHRVAWSILVGQIPAGLFVCHRCDNPPCLNVEHLFLGTCSENFRDMHAKGRGKERKKTHCPAGHSYSGDNFVVERDGSRKCKICRRRRDAIYKRTHVEYYRKLKADAYQKKKTEVLLAGRPTGTRKAVDW